MTAKEILIAVKARIDTPDKWSQGAGTGTRLCSIEAFTVIPDAIGQSRIVAEDLLREAMNGKDASIVEFNDSHTHAEVMAAFDRAIEAAANA